VKNDLACYDPRADGDAIDLPPNQEHLYFAVDDLDAVFDRMQSAGCKELDKKIQIQPWGERSFYARDPFGNPICLVDEKTAFRG
jgi:uncharacterized glyoxalase superfamily protein PhnB